MSEYVDEITIGGNTKKIKDSGLDPKIYIKATLSEDSPTFTSDNFPFYNTEIGVWEEMVIVCYQSDTSQGQTIVEGNWSYFSIRDMVNNTYIATDTYPMGNAPFVLRLRRYPNVLFQEMLSGGMNPKTKALPRASDYVDKIAWLAMSGNNSNIKAGTTIETYIRRFQ